MASLPPSVTPAGVLAAGVLLIACEASPGAQGRLLASSAKPAAPNPSTSASPPPASSPTAVAAPRDGEVTFPSEAVRIIPPKGFVKAKRFIGFEREETGASVVITRMPTGIDEVRDTFSREKAAANLRRRGMTLRSHADVRVSGIPAILIGAEQEARGFQFSKWLVIVGDKRRTVLVVASFLKSMEAEESEMLRVSVLSTQLDPPAGTVNTSGFVIKPSGGLRLMDITARSQMFSAHEYPLPPGEPFFIAGPAHSEMEIKDAKAYAHQRLRQFPQFEVLSVTESQKRAVDGIVGHELVAKARDVESGHELRLYLLILPVDRSYILTLGAVGSDKADQYLAVFRAMALSLKRTKN